MKEEQETLEKMTDQLVEWVEDYVDKPSDYSIKNNESDKTRAQDGFDDGMCEIYGDLRKIMKARVNKRLKDRGIVIE